MSPSIAPEKPFDVSSVAVIGAGPCGLAAAKYLEAEKRFTKIDVFEQRATVGGLWNHSPPNVVDGDFTIPRSQPTTLPDTPTRVEGGGPAQFASPVYDLLETNIPHTLMNYGDHQFPKGSSLFPRHGVVKQYLHDYADSIRDLITFETQVLGVEKVQTGPREKWRLELHNLGSKETKIEKYDAVVIASGHYNDPFIPEIPGLARFNEQHPGSVSHSKFYKRPDEFRDKKVLVVGNSASGVDLSAQISTVSQLPVLVCEKDASVTVAEEKPWARMVPEIAEFLSEDRSVRFSNGEVERNVDAVVFCTGYFYSFPFLRNLSTPVTTDGSCTRHLYEHILYVNDPTLAFIGIPQRVVPFPLSEAQGAYVARIWANRLSLPPREDMAARELATLEKKGARALHNLPFPEDVQYINKLHSSSVAAEKVAGLENDGIGKIPPYWGADKAWTRERFPLIKAASRALGKNRLEIKSLEELGFDYQAWKLENTDGQLQ